MDEYGRPLYGDVFGVLNTESDTSLDNVDKTTKWGELIITETQYESEEEEEEAEEAEEEGKERRGRGNQSVTGTETPADGMTSFSTGLETPDVIDLRKRAAGTETPDTTFGNGELYQVVKEKSVMMGGGGGGVTNQLFASDRTYIIPGKESTSYQDDDGDVREDGEEEDDKGKRKRRLDSSSVAKKYKEFKF